LSPMYSPSVFLRRFHEGIKTSKYFILVSPQKITLAILNTLIILRALELGFGPIGISYITMSSILSYLLVSFVSPRLIYRKDLVRYSLQAAYLALSTSSIMLAIDNRLMLLGSSIAVFTSSYIIYYTIYVSIKNNGVRDKASYISRFETIGGFSWLTGLILGLILTSLFSLRMIPILISIIPFIGLLYSFYYYGVPSYNGGLRKTIRIPVRILFSLRSLPIHSPVKTIRNAVSDVSVSLKYFMLSVFLIQVSISLAFTHLIPYVKSLGFAASQVYLLVVFSSVSSTLSYGFVGRRFRGRNSLLEALGIRILVYLSFIAVLSTGLGAFLGVYSVLLYIPLFMFMGVSWAFISINLSSILLNLKPRQISKVNLAGGVGSVTGILLSGYLFTLIPYPIQILVSLGVMAASLMIVLTKPIIQRIEPPFIIKNHYLIGSTHRYNVNHSLKVRRISRRVN